MSIHFSSSHKTGAKPGLAHSQLAGRGFHSAPKFEAHRPEIGELLNGKQKASANQGSNIQEEISQIQQEAQSDPQRALNDAQQLLQTASNPEDKKMVQDLINQLQQQQDSSQASTGNKLNLSA